MPLADTDVHEEHLERVAPRFERLVDKGPSLGPALPLALYGHAFAYVNKGFKS